MVHPLFASPHNAGGGSYADRDVSQLEKIREEDSTQKHGVEKFQIIKEERFLRDARKLNIPKTMRKCVFYKMRKS